MKLSDWASICGLISRLWPHDKVAPETGEAWYPLVADLDRDDVTVAVRKLRLDPDMRFAPTPGHIRDACNPAMGSWADAIPEIVRRLQKSQTTDDHGNWDAVALYIRTLGPLRRGDAGPVFDPANPTVRAQLRDWWRDHHRQQVDQTRHAVAVAALDVTSRRELEAAS